VKSPADVADQHHNLGTVYRAGGKLGLAEKKFRAALRLNRRLGRRPSMACQYKELGSVLEARKRNREAVRMYEKSRDLFSEVGIRSELKNLQHSIQRLRAASKKGSKRGLR